MGLCSAITESQEHKMVELGKNDSEKTLEENTLILLMRKQIFQELQWPAQHHTARRVGINIHPDF